MVTVAKPQSEFALGSNKLQLDQFVKLGRILAWTQICKICKKKHLFVKRNIFFQCFRHRRVILSYTL